MGPITAAAEAPIVAPARRLSLIDLLALTSGFALAALLVRIFWATLAARGPSGLVVLGAVYLWLGACMSGPILLLLERRSHADGRGLKRRADRPPPGRAVERATPAPASLYTRAELAWMSVGAYWIGAAGLLVPGRLGDSPLALLLVLELLSALGLWVIVPRRRAAAPTHRTWTHRAALVLMATWPLVWVGLVFLAWGR